MANDSIPISLRSMGRKLASMACVTDSVSHNDEEITIRVDSAMESQHFDNIRNSGWKITEVRHYDVATKVAIERKTE